MLGIMRSFAYLLLGAALTGCPRPAIEAHEAAAVLRDNPQRIGTVSRQELASNVTDPDTTIGTPSRPAPITSTATVKIIGTVDSKLCFLVEDTVDARDDAERTATYRQRMTAASFAALALRANGLTGTAPWPYPATSVLVKVRESYGDTASAVVCVPAPVLEDDARLIVFAISWEPSRRLLAMWNLTD